MATRKKIETFDTFLSIPENGSAQIEARSNQFERIIHNKTSKVDEIRQCVNVVDLETGELKLWAMSTHQEQITRALPDGEVKIGDKLEIVDTGKKAGRMKLYEMYLLED